MSEKTVSMGSSAYGTKPGNYSAEGFVIPLLAVSLVVLLTFVSFAVDLGAGYAEKRRLQIGTDAAALAGALRLDGSLDAAANQALVQPEAERAALANNITLVELNAMGGVRVGNWSPANKSFTPDAQPINAVRVMARRTQEVYFASVLGWTKLAPAARSIAARGGANAARCVVPFGIDQDHVNDKEFGDRLFVGFESPGNWGKLDVGGNMSGYGNFYDGFVDGVCGVTLRAGDMVLPAPGFAAVNNGFTDRIGRDPFVIIPIIDEWEQGSSDTVEVLGFVKVKLIDDGSTGHNWTGEVEFVEQFGGAGLGGPTGNPFMPSRALVQ